jgi:hypothetical protein
MPTATANGKKFNFPDGTTPEQMGSAIDEYFAGQQQTPSPAVSPLEVGNIDLNARPVVKNADGTISTVRSLSFQPDRGGPEVLIPTVSDDGRILSDDEAIGAFMQSGRHLGKFKTPEAATAYAEQLHRDQAKMYAQPKRMKLSEVAAPQAQQPQAQPAPGNQGMGEEALNVLGELAAASNRSVTEFVDFLGPKTANAILSLAGTDKRVPLLTESLAPTGIQGNFMDPGIARDATQVAGGLIPAAAGMMPVAGRDLTKPLGAAAELIGAGSAKMTQPVMQAANVATEAVQNVIPSKAREAAKLPLLRQSGDVAAAGFKLEGDRVVKDAIQSKALKAGLDEGAVAMIASANKATKSRIKDMVSVLEGGRKNLEFRNFNTPQKVVGEAITDRLKIIQGANRQAASQLDSVAESLKGKAVDVSPAINTFIDDLNKQGIKVNLQNGSLDFTDSAIEGDNLKEAQGIIRNVFNRLYRTKDPSNNAYRVHTAKQFIDEQVSYGKSPGGLSGKMDGIVKKLRRNLDQSLDSTFPEYNRVNTIYSETRGVIDDLQDVAGSKVDLTGPNVSKALGTMSRKVLSNYASGTATEDLFKSLDDVSRRYSTPLSHSVDDELFKLVSAEAEIRKMFPAAVKPNTLQGIVGTEIGRGAADVAMGNKVGALTRAAKAAGKIFSPTDEAKIKALKDLLDN